MLAYYPTLTKMIESVKKVPEARKVLATLFMPFLKERHVVDPELERICKYLAAEGALISTRESYYDIPSSLIRTLLAVRVLPLDKHPVPNIPPPMCEDEPTRIDIKNIIVNAMKYVNRSLMLEALKLSPKKPVDSNVEDDTVQSEACVHFELSAILRSWLPTQIIIIPEVVAKDTSFPVAGSPPKCDLALIDSNRKYVIEIMVSDNRTSVQNHLHRLIRYKKALNADEGWLVHFTRSTEPPIVDSPERNIHLLTIFHSKDWKTVKEIIRDEEDYSGHTTC